MCVEGVCGIYRKLRSGALTVRNVEGRARERVTRPRLLIARALKNVPRFVSARQVVEMLERSNLKVGTATVYRNLKLMVERGEVDVIHVDGEAFYRECSDGEHHHHVICRICGRTVEVEIPGLEQWIDKAMSHLHYRDVDHDLEIFGICPACARSQDESNRGANGAQSANLGREVMKSDN